ncbi:MAG TPA: glycosyltransferase, partial [Acidobacteriaceae bacterium]|nr:glycosyltransferase [Acidobacteriaceae bacterium]
CDNLVAVDNSPDADAQLDARLCEQGIHVIFNRNKGGLAGAYNRGAEVLVAQNCDVIFLMDQDSDIEPSFFTKMMDASTNLGTEFLMGPKVYEINLKKCMAVFQPGKHIPKRLHIDDQMEGLFPSLCIISSGSAISAAAYCKLGPFREDYFIEYIDIEYSLRAVSQNVPVYMNAGVTMRQTTGQIERHGKGFTTNHQAWRRYYGARNAVHCLYTHRATWGLHWVSAVLAVHQAVCVLRYEPEKLRKITAILCGYVDGLFGLLGTFESRHPLIATYCRKNVHKQTAPHPGSPTTLTEDNV